MQTNERLYVGRPTRRVEGKLKVTGAAPYSAEQGQEGLLFGVMVPATIAAGDISNIDTSAALAFPGVVDVFTHETKQNVAWWDRKWMDQTASPGHPFRPLHSERILYDGQPVAMVVAETFEAARDAASLIRVSYRESEHVTDIRTVLDESYDPPKKRSGIPAAPKPRGEPEAAYEAAPIKISADYWLETEYHNPMEMFATTVLWEDDEHLTIYDKTQGSQNSRDYVCSVFGLKTENVRVDNAFVGGAFGAGLRPRHQLFMAVMASLKLKRSVRVEMTRRDMFYLSHRPSMLQTISLACDATGKLQSVIHHAVAGTSRYEDYQEVVVNWSGLAYACENAKLTYELTQVDTATPGDMRAPGSASGNVALESAMDELAYAAGIDPLELRIINFAPYDQNDDKEFTSKALHACYRQGAAQFGWEKRNAEPGSMQEGNELIGWGMATGFWDAQLQNAAAKARLSSDGHLIVSAAASDIGTGTYTMMAQVAADEFHMAIEDVTVKLGDSTLPQTAVQGGSWTAASTGGAVQAACLAVIATLLKQAQAIKNSPLKDAKADEVTVRDGRLVLIINDQTGVAVADIMAAAGVSFVEEEGKIGPSKLQMLKYISYTHSAVFVEVRVDKDLRIPRVTRIVSAIAAGKIINPKAARSQILGGVVMGMGMALHEEGMFDHRSGRLMNHNLAEYHVPAHADVENIEVIFVEEHDDLASPLGVKGLGEIGLVGVGAAIGNAIYHATGTRVRELPITVDKLL
ncbi:xanthine dehydrogenase family protein molybdopterin-binding subunit [Rhizobium sp. CFBP 8762]|uniref:xanthine dehydrogenase family protein molybdopterin-binding subunit n=1 Tax=Rhizobium sp. CFBP 8762 TaxID=2775279 RepID=UPI00177C6835|nr:xanthine dehydrogenase family protein molybdopterin-binding subunit [Rhizobium sp. CFBP 8762]MBD8553134.1 xanthine dehydrogenase family protein molybdopterin-binding subunit [Rhizobium sp. CFBP 8762]